MQRIKSVGVLSVAKGFAPAFGIAFAVCAPVLYGAMGFVIGALGAFIYNLIGIPGCLGAMNPIAANNRKIGTSNSPIAP